MIKILANGQELAVNSSYLNNSEQYLSFCKVAPNITFAIPFGIYNVRAFYDSYDQLTTGLDDHPYKHYHQMFLIAEYLEDNFALPIIKQKIIYILEAAYPSICTVTVKIHNTEILSFKCQKRPVVIARKLARKIAKKKLCIDFIYFLAVSNIHLISKLNNQHADLLEILDDPKYNEHKYRYKLQFALHARIIYDFHERIKSWSMNGLDSLSGFRAKLMEWDLNQFTIKDPSPFNIEQNNIFTRWDEHLNLQTYLDQLEQQAIDDPELFLKNFNQTQAVFYDDLCPNRNWGVPGPVSQSGIRLYHYRVVIDGQINDNDIVDCNTALCTYQYHDWKDYTVADCLK